MGTQSNHLPQSSQLRVLTLNCWGFKYASKDRTIRIRAIGDEIATSNYDIVGLQELWVEEDYNYIKSKVAHKLPYSKYFLGGIFGAGLATFSRFPIKSTSLHPYSLCGLPLDVARGDWYVGKAVAGVVVDHPLLGEVEIFNTHLYAKGGESPSKLQLACRLVGAHEFSRHANTSASFGRHVLAVGDFNCISKSPTMEFIYTTTGLRDAWGSTHGSFILPRADGVHSPYHAVNDLGVTANSPLNSYSKGKVFDEHSRKYLGKRPDYILFRPAKSKHSQYVHELRCRESSVAFRHHVPGTDISFSDHFGVSATFECVPVSRNSHNNRRPITPPRGASYSPATRSEILEHAISTMGDAHAAAQQDIYKKGVLFAGLVALLVALIIGIAWVPESEVGPALMFISAVTTWAGTALLYAVFMGGGLEARALVRTIAELDLTLQVEENKV
ncbi:unnamed protein product [Rhizoctonia solani]|uniref:Endonuclease/exonuclease/phosphatase domain-containing protein n=1 Tax=Rhizoctonia solani TaxID=456999 RepID=A0A8H3CUU3_9AGAM|nr:unnamed protein product [Rhizoctonia solani]